MRTGSLAIAFVAAVLAAYWLGRQHAVPPSLPSSPVSERAAAAVDTPKRTAYVPAPSGEGADTTVVSPPETLAEIHEIRGDFGQTAALYVLAFAYYPALALVLRRPNEGSLRDWLGPLSFRAKARSADSLP